MGHLRGFARLDTTLDLFKTPFGGFGQIVRRLKVEPELGRRVEVARQAQRGIGGDAAPAVHDLSHASGRNAQLERQPVHTHAERFQVILANRFAGMGKWNTMEFFLMHGVRLNGSR